MARDSLIVRRAKRQFRLQRRRARAIRHPLGPEQQLIFATQRFMTIWHNHIREIMTPMIKTRALRVIGSGGRQQGQQYRTDALLSSAAGMLKARIPKIVTKSPLYATLKRASTATASSVAGQLAKVLTLPSTLNLSEPIAKMTGDVLSGVADLMGESVDRFERVAYEWLERDMEREVNTAAQSFDALEEMLDADLDSILGLTKNMVTDDFTTSFGEMNEAAQVQSGIDRYFWMTQGDDRVRSAHADVANMDSETPYDFNDPPLTADKSSNEEDCNPGDDYNCRCVAVPADAQDLDEPSDDT